MFIKVNLEFGFNRLSGIISCYKSQLSKNNGEAPKKPKKTLQKKSDRHPVGLSVEKKSNGDFHKSVNIETKIAFGLMCIAYLHLL